MKHIILLLCLGSFVYSQAQFTDSLKLVAEGVEDREQFGSAIATHQNFLIVGAPYADIDTITGAGTAYIFEKYNDEWHEVMKLIDIEPYLNDRFGSSVDIHNEFAVVGIPQDDNFETEETQSGSVIVFQYTGASWRFHSRLRNSDNFRNHEFGGSVLLTGDQLVVGAHRVNQQGGVAAGAVYVFRLMGNEWVEVQKIFPEDKVSGGNFGRSIASNGRFLYVGAPGDDDDGFVSGSVYIYELQNQEWIFQGKLRPTDGHQGNRFGRILHEDNGVVLVGAPTSNNDNSDTPGIGVAYVFRKDSSSWMEEAKLIAPDGALDDRFGTSMTILGNDLWLGAPKNDEAGDNAGALYRFQRSDSSWVFREKFFVNTGEETGTQLLSSCNNLILGMPQADSSRGAVWIYNINSLKLEHYHYLRHHIPQFREPYLLNSGAGFTVAADGAKASLFRLAQAPGDTSISNSFHVLIKESINTQDTLLYGSFTKITSQTEDLVFEYRHPSYFPRNVSYHSVNYTIQVLDSLSGEIFMECPLTVVRPPVLMVHGLWSRAEAFNKMRTKLLESNRYRSMQLYTLDYSFTNDIDFQTNIDLVGFETATVLEELRVLGVAAGRMDIVTHSMGGILSRLYLQSDYYFDDINKLINCNTPHAGSQIANFVLDPQNQTFMDPICQAREWLTGLSCYRGAVNDLRVDSDAILSLLNGEPELNRQKTASHSIVTNFDPIVDYLPAGRILRRITLNNPFDLLLPPTTNFFPKLFNEEVNDLIVAQSSQKGGLTVPSTTIINNQVHMGAVNNEEVIDRVLELLQYPRTDSVFSWSGFNPPKLEYNNPLSLFTLNRPKLLIDSLSLSVRSPEIGDIFHPEDSIFIVVEGSDSITHLSLTIPFQDQAVYYGEVEGAVDTFLFIPDHEVLGEKKVLVRGFNENTKDIVVDTSLIFYVLPKDSIQAISTHPNTLILRQGHSKQLNVFAAFSDSIESDITALMGLEYTFSTGKAWQDGKQIYGQDPGLDTLVISFNGIDSDPIPIWIKNSDYLPFLLEKNVSNASCTGDDGNIAITPIRGNPPFTFLWENGSIDSLRTGLTFGTYYITVADATGFSLQTDVTILREEGLSTSVSKKDATCEEGNGSISVQISGGTPPFHYNWNTGDTTSNLNDLFPGLYTVTVTDNFSCSTELALEIGSIPIAKYAVEIFHPSCDQFDGGFSFSAIDGAVFEDFRWNTGDTLLSISGIGGGMYFFTAIDSNACLVSDTFNLMSRVSSDIDIGMDSIALTDIPLSLSVQPLDENLSFLWSTGDTTQSIEVQEAGVYSVIAYNAQGCSSTDTVVVYLITSTANAVKVDTDFIVYPNPTSAKIWLYPIGETDIKLEFLLMDNTGKTILKGIQTGQSSIDLSHLPKGAYLLGVKQKGVTSQYRFSKVLKK